MPQWFVEMQTSDWLLFGIAVALLFFTIDYGGFTPWWKSPLGYIIFGYGLSMALFVGLFIYALITGERASEWFRIPIMTFVLSMIIGKAVILEVLRHQGRIERRARRELEAGVSSAASPLNGRKAPMSTPIPDGTPSQNSAVAQATQIWYKGQRVLRTAFTTLITTLPLVPQIIQIVQGQWDATWLTGVAVQAVALNSALTAIIALPKVNAWLIKIGLGSVPKDAVEVRPSPVTGTPTVIITEDPKVGP
ncbi:membrane protein [Microbacterium phage Fizzles]|nr:membrane protein [Microbacterium phage Fizzles]